MNSTTFSPCAKCQKLNRLAIDSAKQPVCGNCKSPLPIHGAVNELGASELRLLIEKSPVPVVADFWAPWCGPCKVFAPVFENTARQMAHEVVFAKVDTQKDPQAADAHSIRGIPTLIFFQDGIERARQSGALPPHIFSQWLRSRLAGFQNAA